MWTPSFITDNWRTTIFFSVLCVYKNNALNDRHS